MRRVLLADQARALELDAEARGTSVETLMERAGHAVAVAAVELAGGAYGRRAVVLCGKGNNGGDGFVTARHLDAWGMGVAVLLVAGDDLSEPAATNLRRLARSGVRLMAFEADRARRELERAEVAVDAVLGIGLRGPPRPPHTEAITALGDAAVPVVSVDVPSGVEADTGAVPGVAVRPAVTVTFGEPKVGNLLGPGAAAGDLVVADIGYPEVSSDGPGVALVEDEDVAIPPPRAPDAHKRDAEVLVIAGSRTMAGAPALVAAGAYRGGAGYVTLAVPASIVPVVQGAIREAVFLPLPEGPEGTVGGSAWELLEERFAGTDVVALGPGLSRDPETAELVRRLVRECPVPMVVDADGINAFAGRAEDASDRKADLVITPHGGELGRLLGRSPDEVEEDRLGGARAAAAAISAPVLLKGGPSLVAEPDGDVRIVTSGTPVLATAGTGDVLTGLVSAFAARARESSPADAAVAAAHVHGLGGRLAGERLGEGATASDVAGAVAEVIGRIREERSS